MNNATLNIANLLKINHLHPKKSLGQNFLTDESALQNVIDAAELSSESTALEIGAGLGSLTRLLARKARRVVAVEIDQDLFPVLQKVLGKFNNIDLLAGDILTMDPAALVGEDSYIVAANIPYNITSALIRHLLEAEHKPSRLVLTVQREVAMRICASPGEMNLLALGVQVYGSPHIKAYIPAAAFYPVPDVDSAVVRVDLYAQPVIPETQLDWFFRLARAAFNQKRKQLRNSLAKALPGGSAEAVNLLRSAGIDPQRRAETLSLKDWNQILIKIRGS